MASHLPLLAISARTTSRIDADAELSWVLKQLSVNRVQPVAPIGAPKRKASAPSHFGERADSAKMQVRLIVMSRVLLSKDADVLATVAAGTNGAALLEQLRGAFLRLAAASGGDGTARLTPSNIQTLFNAYGSMLARSSAYESLFGLPDRLPWQRAQTVYNSMLAALAAVRSTPAGAAVEALLMTGLTTSPAATPDSVVTAFVAAVEASATAKLNAAAGSSTASSSSTSPGHVTPIPPPPPPPIPLPMPPTPTAPPPSAAALVPSQSIAQNFIMQVESYFRRRLTVVEAAALTASLVEGLHILQHGNGAESRRQLIAVAPLAVAIANAAPAQVWASALGVLEAELATSVDELSEDLTAACAIIATATTAASLGL